MISTGIPEAKAYMARPWGRGGWLRGVGEGGPQQGARRSVAGGGAGWRALDIGRPRPDASPGGRQSLCGGCLCTPKPSCRSTWEVAGLLHKEGTLARSAHSSGNT